jgi:hypothetical protein
MQINFYLNLINILSSYKLYYLEDDLAFFSSIIGFINDRNTPIAVSFNTQVIISSHSHSEETVFTPVSTPRVSADPVFSAVFNTPTDDGNFVVNVNTGEFFTVDTTSIFFESISSINTATNGSVGKEGLLHVFDTADGTVARDLPMSVGSDSRAEEIVVLAIRRRRGNAGLALLLG